MSADELAPRIDDSRLRIVDMRWYLLRPGDGRAAYDEGHIPGAIFLDLDTDLSAAEGPGRHPLPTPDEFRQKMESVGIGSDNDVVVYDDVGGTIAARLWWMLDNLGHRSVAVLDGGIQAWVTAGHPLTTEVPTYAPATLSIRGEWTGIVDRETLAARLSDVTLLDARAPERYRGEVEPIDPAMGHIPTALNAPTAGNLDADGRFLLRGGVAPTLRGTRRGGWHGRHVLRQRHECLPQRTRDARRRLARSGSVRGFVQRLEPLRDAGRCR